MLGDLVTRVLPGRNKEEIEDLLGESMETSYFRGTGRDLIYPTGPQRDSFLAIDSEWLLIWCDRKGRFERYEIRSD